MANNYLPKLVKKDSYAYILLKFLKEHPTLEVCGIDFFREHYPFLGQYPTARLSELKEMGLVDIVGKRDNTIKNIKNIFVYKINDKGLEYKLE